MNIANFFTLLRVLLIPVFIGVYYSGIPGNHLLAAGIFIIAAITDWLDGYLARRLGCSSAFGAFLDPVADKLLVTVTLVMLASSFNSLWFVIPAAIMVAREVLISALREWMANSQARDTVAVGYVGKVKTTFQMIAITVLLASDPAGPTWFRDIGYALIYVAAGLTLWSMIIYIRNAWPILSADLR